MFGFIKRKCTAETLGTIVKKRWNGNLSSKSSSLIRLKKNIKLERFQLECILHRH